MNLYNLYYTPNPSTVDVWFSFCSKQIENALIKNNVELAMEIAYDWANYISEKINLRFQYNWKLFKKAIIKKYFGKYLSKKYKSGWSIYEILAFLYQLEGVDYRISLFPADIACHSTSISLPYKYKSNWHNILKDLNNDTDIEVFQQASDKNTICFRRFTTLFAEEVKYECGYGQAMDVFENEQGRHTIISASKINNLFKINNDMIKSSILYNDLMLLIRSQDIYLNFQSKFLCRQLGIEWISIEGYYNLKTRMRPLIVDIDLPFDYVFMKKGL